MGYKVKLAGLAASLILTAFGLAPAAAQNADPEQAPAENKADHAIGMDLLISTDPDDTDVIRARLNLDPWYKGQQDYLGVRLVKVWYSPRGGKTGRKERG